jgi:hypothetical protein
VSAAHIAALEAALEEETRTAYVVCWKQNVSAVLAEVKRLRAEVEALRADAGRYQFLRGDFSPMGLNIDGQHAWAYRRNATLRGPTLDAAIDAAMKETKE